MNEELYLLFENYLSNSINERERKAFEELLTNDKEVSDKFEIYKGLNGFLETKFSDQSELFKANLKSISNQNFSEKIAPKVITFKPWYYAVAATVVMTLGTWFLMQDNPDYDKYNQHENAYFTERGVVVNNLKLAQDAFNSKKYEDAISNFEIVLKDTNGPEINYFYGISLLEVNRFDEAETVFKNLQIGNSIYKNKATWYMALSSLKQKKYQDCKLILNQIPSDSEDFDKAQELVKQLD
jgi:hypothetical protein